MGIFNNKNFYNCNRSSALAQNRNFQHRFSNIKTFKNILQYSFVTAGTKKHVIMGLIIYTRKSFYSIHNHYPAHHEAIFSDIKVPGHKPHKRR